MHKVKSKTQGQVTTDFRTLCVRLEAILENAHGQFVRAQSAYSAANIAEDLSPSAVRDIQALDVATQTVAAVQEILKKASLQADPSAIPVCDLIESVSLSAVAARIAGKEITDPEAVGDDGIDFF